MKKLSQMKPSFIESLHIGRLLAITWIVFSFVYIGFSLWQQVKSISFENGINQGRTRALDSIVISAKKCQPMNINSDAGSTQIIAMDCLKQATEQAKNSQNGTQPIPVTNPATIDSTE